MRSCFFPVLPSFRPLTSSTTQVQLPDPERQCRYIQQRQDPLGKINYLPWCHAISSQQKKQSTASLVLPLSSTHAGRRWGYCCHCHWPNKPCCNCEARFDFLSPSPPLPADLHSLAPRAQWWLSVELSGVAEMSLLLGCIWAAWSSGQASKEEHSQLLSITTKVSQTHQAHPVTCGFSTTSFHLLFPPIHCTAAGWRTEEAFLLETKGKHHDQLLNTLVGLELVYTKFFVVHDNWDNTLVTFSKKSIQHTIFTSSSKWENNFCFTPLNMTHLFCNLR